MSRARFARFDIKDFKGGVNIEPENAQPNQVLDCRNVWAPHGILEQRPGYFGINSVMPTYQGGSLTSCVLLKETPSGTYAAVTEQGLGNTLDISSLAQESAWLWGINSTDFALYPTMFGLTVYLTSANSNTTYAMVQYWNGTEWCHLPSVISYYPYHLQNTAFQPYFVRPADWALKTIAVAGTDYSRYYLRFVIKGADLDAAVVLNNTTGGGQNQIVQGASILKGLFTPQYTSSTDYIRLAYRDAYGAAFPQIYLQTGLSLGGYSYLSSGAVAAENSIPATLAVIPQFEEAFLAYSKQVFRCEPYSTGNAPALATVEARPEYVGTVAGIKADYHPDYVPQLSEFPRANYIEFFQGQLWAANLLEEPYTVRWSAPQPAHKVWPNESYEILMENDNSPITGLKATSEYLAVFKQDSIWIMVPAGNSPITGLNTYVPVRKVGGIGCVSNSSIVEINGNLIFLAEDGVYAFDGNTAHKISEALDHFFLSVNAGRRPFAAACHWRRKHCYLLSLSIEGSGVNNRVLVYDYSTGSWWFWDNIPAECWCQAEGEYDEETIYFGDSYGNVYQLGLGDTDNGAATDAWFLTHRVAYNGNHRWMFREVDVHGEMQSISALEVDLYRMDGDTATTATSDWRDEEEDKLDTMVLDTDKVEETRRRYRRVVFRDSGRWFKVKVRNTQKGVPMKVSSLSLALTAKV